MTLRNKSSLWHASSRLVAKLTVAGAILAVGGVANAQVTGFGGASMTGWTPNNNVATNPGSAGLPSVVGTGTSADVITMTNNNGGIATSYWFNTPQSILNFTESFTYQQTSNTPGNGADGIGVVWQNLGTSALGAGGGSLGFGGITSAAALGMNIYGGNSGSGSQYNNATSANTGVATTPTPGGVNITSGDPINVSLSYNQTDRALTESMTDASNGSTFTRVWRGIDIAGQVGGSSATIGFTGGTGGVNATQTITNFQFTPGNAIATPIAAITPVATTGYNQNMIVSAANGSANVTATMDGGTGKTGDTFYEVGVNNPTNNVNPSSNVSGMPTGGTVFGSVSDANHTFVLQPNGPGQNDALMLDSTAPSGTLIFTNPKRYSSLSFLVSGANGGGNISATINFAGGGTQLATIAAPDWFNNGPIAWDANGRVSLNADGTINGSDFNNTNDGNPRMYQEDLTLTDTIDPVTSVDFAFGGTNREAVFGISGNPVAVPEPSSMAFLSLGAIGLLIRRRRAARAK